MNTVEESTAQLGRPDMTQATKWCAGLPFAQESDATFVERDMIKARIDRARRSALNSALVALVPIAAFAVLHLLDMHLAALLALLFACVSPLLLIKTWQQISMSRTYGRDLVTGKVWRFAGSVPEHDGGVVDEHHLKLVASRLMTGDPTVHQTVVVLPVAREFLCANEIGVPSRIRAEVIEVADAPLSSFQQPLPAQMSVAESAIVDVTRRRLNPGEVYEIEGKIKHLRRLSPGFWILTVLTGLVFWAWSRSGYPVPPKPITQVIPAGLWIYTVGEVVLNQVRALRLRRDLSLGWALVLEPKPGVADADAVPREILLVSRMSWTVDGIPATWRGSKRFCTLLIDIQR